MSETTCPLCRSQKPLRACEECKTPICRDCATFLEKETFRFHPELTRTLQQSHFCFQCYEKHVSPELEKYQEVLERCKEVTVVSKSFRGLVPCLKKKQEVSRVKNHLDERVAVWHLRFLAAWNGFDAVVGMVTEGVQRRRHGYEHTEWSAKGHFANLNRRRFHP